VAAPARVLPAFGFYWPVTQIGRLNAVELVYSSGHLVPFGANATTNTLSAADHPFVNGDVVRLSNSGGLMPAPLGATIDYHVINATASTLQLAATSGGSAIDLATAGSGLNYLGELPAPLRQGLLALIAHLYEHRTAELVMAPPHVIALIAPYRMMRGHD
jgi:hypothetical protein